MDIKKEYERWLAMRCYNYRFVWERSSYQTSSITQSAEC